MVALGFWNGAPEVKAAGLAIILELSPASCLAITMTMPLPDQGGLLTSLDNLRCCSSRHLSTSSHTSLGDVAAQ
jgi:hypothetical protein